MFQKELLKLDQNDFELRRGCSSDCHSEVRTSMHQVYCCWGELCNKAPGGMSSYSMVVMMSILAICLYNAKGARGLLCVIM